MLFNKVETVDEIFKKIENIKNTDLLEVANEILSFDKLSKLIYV